MTTARLTGPYGYVELELVDGGFCVTHSEDDLGVVPSEAVEQFARELAALAIGACVTCGRRPTLVMLHGDECALGRPR